MKLKTEIKQRHLEAWETAYLAIDTKGSSNHAGAVVRSAIEAGWFDDPVSVDAVGDMAPSEVRRLARDIDKLYTDIISIDPNS
jgi:hypothetical protein